jgi:uncharacterized membrane protein
VWYDPQRGRNFGMSYSSAVTRPFMCQPFQMTVSAISSSSAFIGLSSTGLVVKVLVCPSVKFHYTAIPS